MKPETEAACKAALYAIAKAIAYLDDEAKEAISLDNPPELVRTYADLREQGDQMREAVAFVSKLERSLSYEQIPLAFDRAGIQNVRVVGYGLVSLTRKWSCSILEGKKEDAFDYLRNAGQGGMIIETVPAPRPEAWAHAVTDETGKRARPRYLQNLDRALRFADEVEMVSALAEAPLHRQRRQNGHGERSRAGEQVCSARASSGETQSVELGRDRSEATHAAAAQASASHLARMRNLSRRGDPWSVLAHNAHSEPGHGTPGRAALSSAILHAVDAEGRSRPGRRRSRAGP